ncbi:uncharacterized protein LOC129591745 [Paramacrobiotus metropolitanus]|uniref:uncharacterized protein LOC129591745 n=1 Tax=Paramacrobiotus metropolitanus TaxID=2943436 RepID=UPI0024462268|nr:uncharacterized protein LOC129591745 [Paramacrobiotus metropolitanus]
MSAAPLRRPNRDFRLTLLAGGSTTIKVFWLYLQSKMMPSGLRLKYRARQRILRGVLWMAVIVVQALAVVIEWSDYGLQPPASLDVYACRSGFLCFFINAQSQLYTSIALLCLIALALHCRPLVRALGDLKSAVTAMDKGQQCERQLRRSWIGLHLLVIGFLTYALVTFLQSTLTALRPSPNHSNATNYAFFAVTPQQRQAIRMTISLSSLSIMQLVHSALTLLLLGFGHTASAFNQHVRRRMSSQQRRTPQQTRRLETLEAAMDALFASTNTLIGWPIVTLFMAFFVVVMEGVAHLVEFGSYLTSDTISSLLAFPLYHGCLVISLVLAAEWSAEQRFETVKTWYCIMGQNGEHSVQEGPGNGQVTAASGSERNNGDSRTIGQTRWLCATYTLTCKYYSAAKFFVLNRAVMLQMAAYVVTIVSFLCARRALPAAAPAA